MTFVTTETSVAGAVKRTIVVAGAVLVAASPTLMGFLGKWESGRSTVLMVYEDKLAGGLPTVCDGLTKHVTSTPIVVGEVWSAEKCAEETEAAVHATQQRLAYCFKLPPPQSVFDMATSHAWNNGVANTCGSLAMEAWNEGAWDLGCRRLSKSDAGRWVWTYVRTGRMVNGKPEVKFVQGLANRRADETANCPKDVR